MGGGITYILFLTNTICGKGWPVLNSDHCYYLLWDHHHIGSMMVCSSRARKHGAPKPRCCARAVTFRPYNARAL